MRVAEEQREERFDALFEAYLADMVAYCGWRAQSAADAEDAVSEVLLAAWRRLDDVPAGEDARLWLYGTARRVIANQARAGRRRALLHARLSSAARPEDSTAYGGIPSDDRGAGCGQMASPEVEDVRKALGALKPVDRELLLLSEWEGLTPTQIAAVLHSPVVTARGRLFRARRRFRAALENVGMELQRSESGTARPSDVSITERGVGSPGAVATR